MEENEQNHKAPPRQREQKKNKYPPDTDEQEKNKFMREKKNTAGWPVRQSIRKN